MKETDRLISLEAPVKPCPICGRPPDLAMRPFCSRRCADVDLARWLKGAYAVPAAPEEPSEGDERDGPETTSG
jgi:hypothetical protein